ncbi:sigma-70 family RNA polymerase sigma factor [bacterium]|nr:sigma-70 family RNA polymerase sigma factor [bacterium]
MYENSSDSDLVRKLQHCTEGEKQEILLTLYERYKLLVLKICYHYLADYDQARDTFHDVFIKVIENAPKLQNPSVFKSWLLTIAKNQCVDRLRKTSLLKDQESLTTRIEIVGEQRTEDRYVAQMDKEKILGYLSSCVKDLDEILRTILKLRWQGLKAAQISKILKMDRAELRRSYDRIKRALESCMKSKGFQISIDQIVSLGELDD